MMTQDNADHDPMDLPEVSKAKHALGNRKTAVQMTEQLLARTTDPKTRLALLERLNRFQGDQSRAELALEKATRDSKKSG